MTATARTSITEVGTIFVPVADQDRALALYTETLGFELRVDFVYGGGVRWIEVAPAGATNTISLVGPGEGTPAGGDPADPAARCAFATSDIAADHAALRAAGVDLDTQIAGTGTARTGLLSAAVTIDDPVPAQFAFRDPDGNRFLIVQPG